MEAEKSKDSNRRKDDPKALDQVVAEDPVRWMNGQEPYPHDLTLGYEGGTVGKPAIVSTIGATMDGASCRILLSF